MKSIYNGFNNYDIHKIDTLNQVLIDALSTAFYKKPH